MKNKLIIGSLLTVIIGLVFIVGQYSGKQDQAYGAGNIDQATNYFQTSAGTTTALTSFTYLQYGMARKASTSLDINTRLAEQLEIQMMTLASSTITTYDVCLQTSYDGVTYYPLNIGMEAWALANTATTSIPITSDGTCYRYVPGRTSTSTIAFVIDDIMGSWTRVMFNVGTSTDVAGRGALHARVGVRY